MKKLFAYILLGWLMLPCASRAIDFKQAKFTQVVNSVQVITPDQSRHSAAIDDIFKIPDVLRTGPNSRAELIASDNTITRVGANTIFSFDPASRTIDLQQGSVLFHSPHGKGGGTIHTGSATASVLGTTIIVTTTPNGGFKILVLEGEAEVHFLNGLHATLTPGQMTFILPGGGTSPIVVFRLDKETSGSLLVNGFKDPLPSWPKIGAEITRQLLLLLNNKLQDTGLVVGNNATPDTVQVRMDVINANTPSPFASDSSIIGADHTPNQTLPVNYPELDATHVENGPFTPPVLNSDPTLDSFNQGLLFLGIVNPSAGFVGNNMDIDTASVDLTPFAADPDFEFMAAGDMKIWQSVNFTPSFIGGGGSGGVGVITVEALSLGSDQPGTISLFAGGQMLIAPNSTLEADTGTFGLVAGSFGVLDTTTGLADPNYLNTLLNVSLINQVGDVDVLSLSDLTIEGMNSAYTVEAAGDVNIESDGNLTLGAIPSIKALDNGHNVAIEADSSAYLTAQNDLDIYDAEVVAEYGDIGLGGNVVLNSISGNINVEDNSYLDATGTLSLDAAGNVNLNSSYLQAGNAGNADVYAGGNIGIYYSTIVAGGDVNIQARETSSAQHATKFQLSHLSDISSGGTISPAVMSAESGGNIDVENSEISAGYNGSLEQASTSGGAVNINAYNGNVTLADDTIYAYGGESATSGNVTIYGNGTVDVEDSVISANGNANINAEKSVYLSGDTIDLDYGVNINSYKSTIDIDNTGIAAWQDVNIESYGILTLGLESGDNIFSDNIYSYGGSVNLMSDTSDVDIHNSYFQSDSGNLNVTAGGGVILQDSILYVYANGNITVNAGNGITVNGSLIGGDPEAVTVALNSASGQTTIENGSSVQAFYLNVNSPDGILIDGTGGGSLTGNTMNLTASSKLGQGSGITVQNEDLSGFQSVNVRAHTVNLDNDNLSGSTSYNLTSFYGGYYIDNGHQAGYVNFNNDTLDHNPIVNLDTPGTLDPNNNAGIGLVTLPSSSPGIHVLSASVPGVASSVSLPASSPVNVFAANVSGSNPGVRAIGH